MDEFLEHVFNRKRPTRLAEWGTGNPLDAIGHTEWLTLRETLKSPLGRLYMASFDGALGPDERADIETLEDAGFDVMTRSWDDGFTMIAMYKA